MHVVISSSFRKNDKRNEASHLEDVLAHALAYYGQKKKDKLGMGEIIPTLKGCL